MKKERILPAPLKWPRWKYSFKWFTFIPYILGFFAFFVPDLENKYRIIIGIFLLLLPVLTQTFLWIGKIIVTICKRTNYYPNLYNYYQNVISEFEELKELFYCKFINIIKDNILEIKGAKYQRGKLYIALQNNSKLNLKKSNKIVVFDKKDWIFLGQFEITEVRKSEYIALGIKVDPVWQGYVRQKGETTIMPNITAIYLHSGE